MRAAYYLKHIHSTLENGRDDDKEHVVSILQMGLLDTKHGSLLRHEFAYVMGQMKDERSCIVLEEVLSNDDDCVMVRHECAEALGAIGFERSIVPLRKVLQRHANCLELAETCQLALDVIEWRNNGEDGEQPAACACMLNPYSSIDPAPPHPSHQNKSADELGSILGNNDLPIFERYRAMFSLRNKGGRDCVLQLCSCLVHDTTSALLRHEVAYVLGQMQHSASVDALEQSLRRENEHEMVRHESAEALGAIEGRWDDCEKILQEFTSDTNIVVRESCLVALDAADYWGNNTITEEENEEETISSFSQQKNASEPPNRILVNHFNVKQ
mmetsp:Transcript_14513/g.16647  ORF Transcript_14513/g.16647 Transcript_14513/m.16647 type:complete len:328 (+) Transcript_14513:3-986(+)